jgi:hypothetical protein
MPDAVREEDRHRLALDQILGVAAEQAELAEPFGDHELRAAVDLAKLRSRQATLRGLLARSSDDSEELSLLGGEVS